MSSRPIDRELFKVASVESHCCGLTSGGILWMEPLLSSSPLVWYSCSIDFIRWHAGFIPMPTDGRTNRYIFVDVFFLLLPPLNSACSVFIKIFPLSGKKFLLATLLMEWKNRYGCNPAELTGLLFFFLSYRQKIKNDHDVKPSSMPTPILVTERPTEKSRSASSKFW